MTDIRSASINWRRAFALALPLIMVLGSCATKKTLTQTPRSPIEQRLLAGAVERAAIRLEGPDFEGAAIHLEVAGLTQDALFAGETVASELQSRGAVVVSDPAKARYVVKLLVQALGVDRTERFFGIPSMNSFLLPVPEITLFNWIKQTGVSRLSIRVVDARTGRLVGSTEKVDGVTVFSRMTILPFAFEAADFNEPP
jgi:hypothetical protein